MLTHMGTVKWDIKDIMSQHSQYVDGLLKVRDHAVIIIIVTSVSSFRSSQILLTKLLKLKSMIFQLYLLLHVLVILMCN